nr:hypothetical protein [Tanacetum cinerariifolium]
MGHQEIHKFCDGILKKVLEGFKSYNNDVKHAYVASSLSKEDVEYLRLFKEEIEEQLKHRDQMRRWEIGANGFVNMSLSNSATSSCGSTFVKLIGEFVALMFGEVLGEGASLYIEEEEEYALAVSDRSRGATKIRVDTTLGDLKYSSKNG